MWPDMILNAQRQVIAGGHLEGDLEDLRRVDDAHDCCGCDGNVRDNVIGEASGYVTSARGTEIIGGNYKRRFVT